jgi:DNA polymerase-3 subunit alpha
MESSGQYAFSLNHAQGYSLITSWGAYMKAHYFLEYMTACLMGDSDKRDNYLREIRREGYKILPPDINMSEEKFSLAGSGVLFGLSDVMYVGEAAIKEIITHRPYTSFDDFISKVKKRSCGSRVVGNLIRVGAFDSLEGFDARSYLLGNFLASSKNPPAIPLFTDANVLARIEKELMGTYVTRDPFDQYIAMIEGECILSAEVLEESYVGEIVCIGGKISYQKEWQAKNGLMCFVDVVYNDEIFPVTIFADLYQNIRSFVHIDAPVICQVLIGKKGAVLRDFIRLDLLGD